MVSASEVPFDGSRAGKDRPSSFYLTESLAGQSQLCLMSNGGVPTKRFLETTLKYLTVHLLKPRC